MEPCGHQEGHSAYGQLGDGTLDSRSTPVQVKNSDNSPIEDVISISASASHSLFCEKEMVPRLGGWKEWVGSIGRWHN